MAPEFSLELCLPDCALVGHITLYSYPLRACSLVVSYCYLVFLCMATFNIAKEVIKCRSLATLYS